MDKNQNKKSELTKAKQKKSLFIILNLIIIIVGSVLVYAQDPSVSIPDPGLVNGGSLSEQQKFDLMDNNQIIEKWEKIWTVNALNHVVDLKKIQKERTDWLNLLTGEQQERLLSSVSGVEIKGLEKYTNPGDIIYKADEVDNDGKIIEVERVIVTDNEKGTETIPLNTNNLHNIGGYEIRKAGGKIGAYVSYDKEGIKGEVFLRDGTYVVSVASSSPSPSDISESYDVYNSKGEFMYKAHFGEAKVSKFLADNSGKYQIWAKGHLGDKNGAEIRLFNEDGNIRKVFPHPDGPIDKSSGLHYIAAKPIENTVGKNNVLQVYGNIKSPGFGGYGYNDINGIIFDFTGKYQAKPDEKVLSVVRGSDGSLTINDVNKNLEKYVVFNVLEKDKQFVDRTIFQYVTQKGVAKGFVPRYGGIADIQDIGVGGGGTVTPGRVGGGTGPISKEAAEHYKKLLEKFRESSSEVSPGTTIRGNPDVSVTKPSPKGTGEKRTRVYVCPNCR